MYVKAKKILASELMYAKNMSEDEALEWLELTLTEGAKPKLTPAERKAIRQEARADREGRARSRRRRRPLRRKLRRRRPSRRSPRCGSEEDDDGGEEARDPQGRSHPLSEHVLGRPRRRRARGAAR